MEASATTMGDQWKAKGARIPFGDGITSGDRLLVSMADLTIDEAKDALDSVNAATTWNHTSQNLSDWLSQHFSITRLCPYVVGGDRNSLCCGVRNLPIEGVTERNIVCCGGNWRERADPEWYIAEIWKLWSVVSEMVAANNADLTAHYAVELGLLVAEHNFKFGFERDALSGIAVREGAARGGRAALQNDPAVLIKGVEAVRARSQLSLSAAFTAVGNSNDCSASTVKRAWYQKISGSTPAADPA
jgi:hypothetical protein